MDNITIICESEASEKIQMIMRQTNYDHITAREKLIQHNDDPIKVIKLLIISLLDIFPVNKKVSKFISLTIKSKFIFFFSIQ